MSKLLQRGASTALRMQAMRASTKTELTPQQLEELGKKINPAQEVFGPKDPNVEKWQKFFQDPINEDKPIFRRKGFTDDVIVSTLGVIIFGTFAYNVGDFIFGH